jgi:hypothetical protein
MEKIREIPEVRPVDELLQPGSGDELTASGNEDEKLDEFRESLGGPMRDWGELLTRDEEEEEEEEGEEEEDEEEDDDERPAF